MSVTSFLTGLFKPKKTVSPLQNTLNEYQAKGDLNSFKSNLDKIPNNYLSSPTTNLSGSAVQSQINGVPVTAKQTNDIINKGGQYGSTKISPTKPKELTFKKGEVTNKYGNYSKSNIAKKLGISKDELNSRVKAGGFKNSLDYYNSGSWKTSSQTSAQPGNNLADQTFSTLSTLGVIPQANAQTTNNPGTPGMSAIDLLSKVVRSSGVGKIIGSRADYTARTNPDLINPRNTISLTPYAQQRLSGDVLSTNNLVPTTDNNIINNANPDNIANNLLSNAGGTAGSPTTAANAVTPAELEQTLNDTATEGYDLAKEQAINDYNQSYALGEQQISEAGTMRDQQLAQNELDKQKLSDMKADSTTEIMNTAQQGVKIARNMMRALGILSSSAAGEVMSRPILAAQQSIGKLTQSYVNQANELMLREQTIRDNFNNIIKSIRTDQRFSLADQQEAIQAATVALNQQISNNKLAMVNLTQQLDSQRKSYLLDLAKLAYYSGNNSVYQTLVSQVLG